MFIMLTITNIVVENKGISHWALHLHDIKSLLIPFTECQSYVKQIVNKTGLDIKKKINLHALYCDRYNHIYIVKWAMTDYG